MGTLTIGLSGSGIVNGSKAYAVSDADIQRLLNVMLGLCKLDPASTSGQILLAWVQRWIDQTISEVKYVEGNAAAASAQQAVAPIGMS